MGIGGGFILVRSMIYLLRCRTSTVIGTLDGADMVTMTVRDLSARPVPTSRRRRAGADLDDRGVTARSSARARPEDPRRAVAACCSGS